MRLFRLYWFAIVSCALVVPNVGCGGDDDPGGGQCVEDLDLACTPPYTPTYDTIFDDILVRKCGAAASGGSCHYGPTADLAQGGLPLSDREMAYAYLLGHVDGRARVLPGDPACSLLVERLESTDPNFVMPRGAPLPDATRCAVRLWIANGAAR